MSESAQLPLATPLARIYGEPLIEVPSDLYIPPDALEILLDAFQGPLDLLLYLIRKQNLDILDIPMAPLTRQYLEYVELMRGKNLELAAEYLVMAAMLIEIKSRMLLPRPVAVAEEEDRRPPVGTPEAALGVDDAVDRRVLAAEKPLGPRRFEPEGSEEVARTVRLRSRRQR